MHIHAQEASHIHCSPDTAQAYVGGGPGGACVQYCWLPVAGTVELVGGAVAVPVVAVPVVAVPVVTVPVVAVPAVAVFGTHCPFTSIMAPPVGHPVAGIGYLALSLIAEVAPRRATRANFILFFSFCFYLLNFKSVRLRIKKFSN